jgi:tRNA U55 pseudouridine synthase TruB
MLVKLFFTLLFKAKLLSVVYNSHMIHGWLNLDKPIGISSAQAVTQVKKIFGIEKAGHLGTLDPLASGVLPITLGEATKTIPYLSCDLKAYDFTIKWANKEQQMIWVVISLELAI